MKIYISHAATDEDLASRLAEQLSRAGFAVWNADEEIAPGDNWAKAVGRALDEADVMVVLITQGALKSGFVQREIEFGLTSKNFKDRLVPVLVDYTTFETGKEVPWILLTMNPVHLDVVPRGSEGFEEVVKRVHGIAAQQETNAPC